jgi:Zn-dependent oligopeptidase
MQLGVEGGVCHPRVVLSAAAANLRAAADGAADMSPWFGPFKRSPAAALEGIVSAGLADEAKARLQAIDARLAVLSSQFNRNLLDGQNAQVTWLERGEDLAGLDAAQRQAATQAAAERDRPTAWAIANQRPAVWPFLAQSTQRDLREHVWRLWNRRGGNDGPHDNRSVTGEMLQLRGEPMSDDLIDRLEASLKADRIFSVNLDYLGAAIVDLELHLLADGSGRNTDAVAVERQTLAELGMPACWDLILQVTHSVHCFAGGYHAGLYAYLWSDVMAADVAEAWLASPGGLYDPAFAQAWRESILTVGHVVPADAAFRQLMERDPDPAALMRRLGLQ